MYQRSAQDIEEHRAELAALFGTTMTEEALGIDRGKRRRLHLGHSKWKKTCSSSQKWTKK